MVQRVDDRCLRLDEHESTINDFYHDQTQYFIYCTITKELLLFYHVLFHFL